jgi:hypothetical protein
MSRPLLAAATLGSLFFLASRSAEGAPVPPPTSTCGTDAECLDKLFTKTIKSKVTSVVDAAMLTTATDTEISSSKVQRASARVASWRGSGLDVVCPAGAPLGDGVTLLALSPADAETLVSGGLFRRVG